jgi:hypothetical protein
VTISMSDHFPCQALVIHAKIRHDLVLTRFVRQADTTHTSKCAKPNTQHDAAQRLQQLELMHYGILSFIAALRRQGETLLL